MAEIVAAAIAAAGAVTAAVFAALAKSRSDEARDLDKRIANVERETLAAEGELWKRFANLPEGFPTRREFERLESSVNEIRSDVQELRDELRRDTNRILEAIKSG